MKSLGILFGVFLCLGIICTGCEPTGIDEGAPEGELELDDPSDELVDPGEEIETEDTSNDTGPESNEIDTATEEPFDHETVESGCYECHQDDHEKPVFEVKIPHTDPAEYQVLSHVEREYPTDCERCHKSRSTFLGAEFGHPDGNESTCEDCHMREYTLALRGNHVATGIPEQLCNWCHDPAKETFCISTLWENHDFLIGLYGHGGLEAHSIHAPTNLSCADCHGETPRELGVQAECLSCHVHQQSPMDTRHAAVEGYEWESQKCINCHPTGYASADI